MKKFNLVRECGRSGNGRSQKAAGRQDALTAIPAKGNYYEYLKEVKECMSHFEDEFSVNFMYL